jgi:hypothetical protein
VSSPREFPGETRYVVTAPMIFVHCGSSWQMLYEGAALPEDVNQRQLERLVRADMIRRSEPDDDTATSPDHIGSLGRATGKEPR